MLHSGVDSVSMCIFKDMKLASLKLFYTRCCKELDEVSEMTGSMFIGGEDQMKFIKRKM